MTTPLTIEEYEQMLRSIMMPAIKQEQIEAIMQQARDLTVDRLRESMPDLDASEVQLIIEGRATEDSEWVKNEILKVVARRQAAPPARIYTLHKLFVEGLKTQAPDTTSQPFLKQARQRLDAAIFNIEVAFRVRTSDEFPAVTLALSRLHSARKNLTYLLKLEDPQINRVDDSSLLNFTTKYKIKPNHKDKEPQINRAIHDLFQLIYVPMHEGKSIKLIDLPTGEQKKVEKSARKVIEVDDKQYDLFSNSKDVDLSVMVPVSQFVANHFGKAKIGANRQEAEKQYANNKRASIYTVTGSDKSETAIHFDNKALNIRSTEDFVEQVLRLRNAKVTQTLLALSYYAAQENSIHFRSVPISDIMKLMMNAQKKVNFTSEQRREFSDSLLYLSSLTITHRYIHEQFNQKTNKSKPVLLKETGVKIFRMIAEYAVKKQYQHLPKEELNAKEHFDETVITRFSGELLPSSELLLSERAHTYFAALLRFDPNKDEKAINLGTEITRRFNQMSFKGKLSWERGYLIELCDYQKTDNQKPLRATEYLEKNLSKLVKAGIILKFDKVTNSNSDKVNIYPPVLPINLSE